jgi:hypothetical protein
VVQIAAELAGLVQEFGLWSWCYGQGRTVTEGVFYLDHCVPFGGKSVCGVFSWVANAFVVICNKRGLGPSKKWVDDFVFLRRVDSSSVPEYDLDDILRLGEWLGWPWKGKKTRSFAPSFHYLGFAWSLEVKLVSIPLEKKEKYLDCLATWSPLAQILQKKAVKMLGTLVHCTLAVPKGRSRLGELIQFALGLEAAHSQHT